MNNDNRNMIAFVIIAVLLLVAYQTLVMGPAVKRQQAQKAAAEASQKTETMIVAPVVNLSRAEVLAKSARIGVDTRSPKCLAKPDDKECAAAVYGTISLQGARLDDLFLRGYRQTIDKRSAPVELLRPEGVKSAYFAELGWRGANLSGVPTNTTVWQAPPGAVLNPNPPRDLYYQGGGGLTFTRTIAVDERSMFTITDRVTNGGTSPVTLAPYGTVQRVGLPEALANSGIVHEGAIGVLDGNLQLRKYTDWKKQS